MTDVSGNPLTGVSSRSDSARFGGNLVNSGSVPARIRFGSGCGPGRYSADCGSAAGAILQFDGTRALVGGG